MNDPSRFKTFSVIDNNPISQGNHFVTSLPQANQMIKNAGALKPLRLSLKQQQVQPSATSNKQQFFSQLKPIVNNNLSVTEKPEGFQVIKKFRQSFDPSTLRQPSSTLENSSKAYKRDFLVTANVSVRQQKNFTTLSSIDGSAHGTRQAKFQNIPQQRLFTSSINSSRVKQMKARNTRYASLTDDCERESQDPEKTSTNIVSTKRPSIMKRNGDVTNKFIELNAGKINYKLGRKPAFRIETKVSGKPLSSQSNGMGSSPIKRFSISQASSNFADYIKVVDPSLQKSFYKNESQDRPRQSQNNRRFSISKRSSAPRQSESFQNDRRVQTITEEDKPYFQDSVFAHYQRPTGNKLRSNLKIQEVSLAPEVNQIDLKDKYKSIKFYNNEKASKQTNQTTEVQTDNNLAHFITQSMDLSYGSPNADRIQDQFDSIRQFEQNLFGFSVDINNNNGGNNSDQQASSIMHELDHQFKFGDSVNESKNGTLSPSKMTSQNQSPSILPFQKKELTNSLQLSILEKTELKKKFLEQRMYNDCFGQREKNSITINIQENSSNLKQNRFFIESQSQINDTQRMQTNENLNGSFKVQSANFDYRDESQNTRYVQKESRIGDSLDLLEQGAESQLQQQQNGIRSSWKNYDIKDQKQYLTTITQSSQSKNRTSRQNIDIADITNIIHQKNETPIRFQENKIIHVQQPNSSIRQNDPSTLKSVNKESLANFQDSEFFEDQTQKELQNFISNNEEIPNKNSESPESPSLSKKLGSPAQVVPRLNLKENPRLLSDPDVPVNFENITDLDIQFMMYMQKKGLDVNGQPLANNNVQLDHLIDMYLNRQILAPNLYQMKDVNPGGFEKSVHVVMQGKKGSRIHGPKSVLRQFNKTKLNSFDVDAYRQFKEQQQLKDQFAAIILNQQDQNNGISVSINGDSFPGNQSLGKSDEKIIQDLKTLRENSNQDQSVSSSIGKNAAVPLSFLQKQQMINNGIQTSNQLTSSMLSPAALQQSKITVSEAVTPNGTRKLKNHLDISIKSPVDSNLESPNFFANQNIQDDITAKKEIEEEMSQSKCVSSLRNNDEDQSIRKSVETPILQERNKQIKTSHSPTRHRNTQKTIKEIQEEYSEIGRSTTKMVNHDVTNQRQQEVSNTRHSIQNTPMDQIRGSKITQETDLKLQMFKSYDQNSSLKAKSLKKLDLKKEKQQSIDPIGNNHDYTSVPEGNENVRGPSNFVAGDGSRRSGVGSNPNRSVVFGRMSVSKNYTASGENSPAKTIYSNYKGFQQDTHLSGSYEPQHQAKMPLKTKNIKRQGDLSDASALNLSENSNQQAQNLEENDQVGPLPNQNASKFPVGIIQEKEIQILKELIENQMKIQNLENSLNEYYTFQEVVAVHPELSARSKLSFVNIGAEMGQISKKAKAPQFKRSLGVRKSPRSSQKKTFREVSKLPFEQNQRYSISQRNPISTIESAKNSTFRGLESTEQSIDQYSTTHNVTNQEKFTSDNLKKSQYVKNQHQLKPLLEYIKNDIESIPNASLNQKTVVKKATNVNKMESNFKNRFRFLGSKKSQSINVGNQPFLAGPTTGFAPGKVNFNKEFQLPMMWQDPQGDYNGKDFERRLMEDASIKMPSVEINTRTSVEMNPRASVESSTRTALPINAMYIKSLKAQEFQNSQQEAKKGNYGNKRETSFTPMNRNDKYVFQDLMNNDQSKDIENKTFAGRRTLVVQKETMELCESGMQSGRYSPRSPDKQTISHGNDFNEAGFSAVKRTSVLLQDYPNEESNNDVRLLDSSPHTTVRDKLFTPTNDIIITEKYNN